ncbi:hypothetical protein, partial [Ideonella sp.]|uniref:hypothetical protein n=1 Tax=Ideonella sp. TaxID=1929293 RepID=UPI003BB74E5A
LILVHCGLRIGSLNAAVALFSMLIVAASGVIGRFIYVRVHHGLSGRKAELGEAQAALQADERQINDRLASLPEVCATLLDFQRAAMATSRQGRLSRTLWLSWQARVVRQRVHGQLHAVLMKTPPSGRSALLRSWLIQTDGHLTRVLKVAQFSAWERLFALWHVLHVPFVWVMVVCALAHVVAVHAY